MAKTKLRFFSSQNFIIEMAFRESILICNRMDFKFRFAQLIIAVGLFRY